MLTSERVPISSGASVEVHRGGTGAPLVYVHGLFGVDADDPVADALAKHFEVIAPLHPGFADLDELDAIRDVHDLAFHYDSLLDVLGLDAVAVIGFSYGGMVAAELAAHVPSRVSTLLLVSPFGIWRDDQPAPDIFRAYPRALDDLLWSEGARPHADAGAVAESDNGTSSLDRMLAMAQGMTSVGKFMWPLPDKGLERRLHRIRARTLVVWGSDDRLVPRTYVDAFAAGITGASLAVVDGAGHMLPVERPDEFRSIVADFVDAG